MQKVITVNLSGNAYQLEEPAHDALGAYLERAGRALANNPDGAEILADLEQAIADKCQTRLGSHKTVVTHEEMLGILAEMGPVDSGSGDAGAGRAAGAARDGDARPAAASAASGRRFYRIREGSMVGGICTGLAAYFQIDVTLVRAAFVIMALITQGAGIIAYIVLMFVIPEASTAEERAAAGGLPSTARDIVNRAKGRYAEERRRWRREWRRHQRRREHAQTGYPMPPAMAAMLPVFTLLHVALFVLGVAIAIALVNTGQVAGWHPPEDVPLWAALLVLLVIYQVAVSPLRAITHWGTRADAGWFAFWHAVVWLIGVAFVIWIASNHLGEIREFLQRLPEIIRDFALAVRRLWAR